MIYKMRNYMKYFMLIILYVLAFNEVEFAQDTTKQVQYRRGIELQPGYQSYDEKYFGKNILEEKRSKLPLQSTGVWTELNPKVPRVDYIGIDFINPDTGWAVGDLGAIIKTTNGGDDWTISETNTTTLLLKVHSFNGQIVIVTGYDGIILRSSDGGETFEQIPSGVGSGIDLWGVQMLNDTLGWICGMNNTLLKTTDAGLSWQAVNAGLNVHYWSLNFLNENYGMIACGGGKVLKTTDGGNSWTQTQAGDTRDLYTIDVMDSLHIAAAGGSFGKNVYSSDGGTSWTENTNLPYSAGANWIYFIDTDTGYVTGNSLYLRKTTNRGQSWFSTPYFEIGRWQFEILNGNTGYGVGDNLTITKTEDDFNTGRQLILNVNFADVFFINEMKGFAIGGALYKTEDGGINWEKMTGAPGGSDILFLDSLAGFIGASGSIFKTTDGGESWYATQGSTGAGRIFFINETTGWAIRNNEIYKTTDRGENWFVQSNSGWLYTSIYFIDSLYGWTSQIGGRPFKTTDGGLNWIEHTNLNIWESRDIYFKNDLNGYLLESNKLYETLDEGSTFNLIPGITGFSIAAKFTHYANNTIFITGYKVYRSIDGGLNWIDFDELSVIRINGLSLLGMGTGFAVGELGIVLKYNDEIVPVELISFTSSVNVKDVTLNWQTATETNNSGFEIERNTPHNPLSRGEAEGRGVWRSIGFVNGNGTTTEPQSYSFLDKELSVGKYQYRLKQIDFDGTFEYSNTIEVEIGNPTKFSLEQNYPNPFNPSTTIRYQIPQDGIVTLKIYNILGSEVATLVNEEKVAGKYEVNFNASSLASGVYVYKIQSGSFIKSKKMILIK
jgi:photosystem II stability/assembly factor-like uncharacterized protein